MEHARSGRRYRFLFPVRGAGVIGGAVVRFLIVLMALVPICGLGYLALRGLRDITAPTSAFNRLQRAPTAIDVSGGRTWGTGVFRTRSAEPLCYTERQHYVSGKNGGWRTDASAWIGESPTLELGQRTWSVDTTALRFEPFDPAVVVDDSVVRARVRYEDGGRIRSQCAQAGQPVFVDVCVTSSGNTIGACADGTPSVITLGDGTATARIRDLANSNAAATSMGLLILGLVALYLWRAIKVDALVEAIGSWSRDPPLSKLTAVYVLCGVGALVAWLVALAFGTMRNMVPYYVSGYGLGATVLCVMVAGVVTAFARRARVQRAIAVVERAETARLAHVGDGMAELAVRLRDDAETVSLPDHGQHAFVRVSVGQVVTYGRNVRVVPVATVSWPKQVPVEDPSGVGLLELKHAVLDTRATFRTLRDAAAHAYLRALATTPFGGHPELMHDPRLTIEVEESYLDRGERLFLTGNIRRVRDPSASKSYRDLGTVPVIHGAGDGELAVHAGNEDTLLGTLARERTWISIVAGTLCGLSVAHAALLAWLATRA